jgi:hypothetical protein
LPNISTWSLGGGVKNRPNGFFNPKQLLRGTPASGLPFLLAILVLMAIGFVVGTKPDPRSFIYLWAVFAAWGFAWSLGWAASALTSRQGPEASKRLQLLFLFGAAVLPGFMLWVAEASAKWANLNLRDGWSEDLYLFSFITDDMPEAAIKALVLTLLALGIGTWAEFRRRSIVNQMRNLT